MRQLTAALLILFVAAFAGSASAQDGPKAAKAALQASKDLEGYFARTAAAKAQPNLQAAPGGPLFTRVFDIKTLRALPPTGASDLPWLGEWLGATANAYMALVNFGTDPKSQTYMESVAANVERHEDDIARALEFMLRLFARVSNSASAYAQSLREAERNDPARQKSLAGVRSGYMKSMTGAIQFAANDIKPANAQLVARAARDTAQDFAASLSPEQRAEMANFFSQAAAETKDPETESHFTAIIQTFNAAK